MIVCSCNTIDHREIEEGVDRLFEADPYRIFTPVGVYKAIGKRPQCGGCMSLASHLIHARVECLRNCGHCPLAAMARIAAPCDNEVADEHDEMALHPLD